MAPLLMALLRLAPRRADEGEELQRRPGLGPRPVELLFGGMRDHADCASYRNCLLCIRRQRVMSEHNAGFNAQ